MAMLDLTTELGAALLEFLPEKDVMPYCARVLRDYEEIVPHLPPDVKAILDIGAGWGGHALYLAKHYGPDTMISIIEGSVERKKEHSGFRKDTQPYRNGVFGLKMLEQMGVRAKMYPVNDKTAKLTIPSDLITSFCSLGHHYHLDTYITMISQSLNVGGRLLVDIRAGTDQLEMMDYAMYEVVKIVKSKPKFSRVLFKRRGDDKVTPRQRAAWTRHQRSGFRELPKGEE